MEGYTIFAFRTTTSMGAVLLPQKEEDGYDDSTYMPLYRAMKSGGAHVCSVLVLRDFERKDIERFQRLFYRTILEECGGALASNVSSLPRD